MEVRTVCWLVFLAIAEGCNNPNPFTLESTQLTAKEGSCVEITCKVTVNAAGAGGERTYWFWMKDPVYNHTRKDFDATIVYSSEQSEHPVSEDFAKRTTYIGSSSWNTGDHEGRCSILICNLNKTDSGNYSFRHVNKQTKCNTWATKPEANLTVVDNPCPITFEKPPAVVVENQTITLTCKTRSSCPSSPQIHGLTPPQPDNIQMNSEGLKVTTLSFNATWKHDRSVFSCQTQDNTDKYLIQNISLAVEYPPKDTQAVISPNTVKENSAVTLACSARGAPEVNFTWFKVGHDGDEEVFSGANWTIESITVSQNGSYYCQAKNKHGEQKSSVITIDVQYHPSVEILISPEEQLSDQTHGFLEGNAVTLTCNVTRANPLLVTFNWYKDSTSVNTNTNAIYHIKSIKPEDSGIYKCTASNTVGLGTSNVRQLNVLYKPRNTRISFQGAVNNMVKVGSSLTITCNTDAYPNNVWSSLYSSKKTDPLAFLELYKDSHNKAITRWQMYVQRTDEACYTCNASNTVGEGDKSPSQCLQVLFPPTNVALSMDTMVKEGQHMTVNCTAESYPSSQFTLMTPSGRKTLEPLRGKENTYQHTFTVSSTDAGDYKCEASNSEGTNNSMHRKLVVNYAPKDVKVEAPPNFVVKENQTLTLNCRANSVPNVISVTWMKMTNGTDEPIPGAQKASFSVKSASPSDSGLYSCTVANEIGRNKSKQVEIKVMYAPKHIKITQGPVQQRPDGTSFVMLSCSSHSYPPVKYSWHRKMEMDEGRIVYYLQNITVNSTEPGEYYCIAKNKISYKQSEPVSLFDDSTMKAVKLFFLSCFILLCLLFIFFVCRRRTNKSSRRTSANTWTCFGFLVWWNQTRRINQMNETRLVEPSRSRDDLLPDQPCRVRGQQWQPHPDRTPAPPIETVYCTVNLPKGQQAPSAQKPKITNGGHTEGDSLNYASLQFANKQKTPGEDVYAQVSKSNSSGKKGQEQLGDYENVSAACAAKPPDLYDSDDTDTSDEEVSVNYSQVTFKPKFGHQTANRLSSSSSEETQYSDVKI